MVQRLIAVRKKSGLNQEQFAEKIGMSRSFINQVEVGKRNVSDRTIADICRIFGVNEDWLRTGKGEMFNQTEETVVGRLCAELHASELESGIIRAYFRIDSRIREPFMQRLIQEMQAEYTALVPSSAETDKTKQARTEEQKTPTPVSESGQNDLNEIAFTVFQGLNPDQKQ